VGSECGGQVSWKEVRAAGSGCGGCRGVLCGGYGGAEAVAGNDTAVDEGKRGGGGFGHKKR